MFPLTINCQISHAIICSSIRKRTDTFPCIQVTCRCQFTYFAAPTKIFCRRAEFPNLVPESRACINFFEWNFHLLARNSNKFDSFRKFDSSIQKECFEFPLFERSSGQIHTYKTVFSAAEGDVDRKADVFVSGNNPTNSIDCIFAKNLQMLFICLYACIEIWSFWMKVYPITINSPDPEDFFSGIY